MNYRLATLLAQTDYAADKTEIIDINVADPISEIVIKYSPYNTAQTEGTAHPIACLTKIELVDGSDVLFSLNGHEAQALDIYHHRKLRSQWFHYLDNNYTDMVVGINFGRYLWDTEFAFDPKKFTNPQLKVTIDLDAGAAAPDAGRMEIYALLFDDKEVTPSGMLIAKEVVNYTLADSAHEYVDMPTDHAWRKMLIRAQRYGTEPNQQLANIKLSEDQDKRVVFDHKHSALVRTLGNAGPMIREHIILGVSTASKNFYCTASARVNGMIQTWATAVTAASAQAFYDGDGGRFKIRSTVAGNVQALINGWIPHATLEIPFGLQDDPADWYDMAKIGSIRADITGASSVGTSQTCQVFLQQLRKYAAA